MVWLLGSLFPLRAQTSANIPQPTSPELRAVVRQAGAIFAGRVISVEPVRIASAEQVASVQVTFQVEQAIRGARVGQRLSFREWAGLWSRGERYRVGQRTMLFLYAPSALGLTSPVGGAAGRFAVDGNDRIVLSEVQQQRVRVAPAPIPIDTNGRIQLKEFTRAIRRMGEE